MDISIATSPNVTDGPQTIGVWLSTVTALPPALRLSQLYQGKTYVSPVMLSSIPRCLCSNYIRQTGIDFATHFMTAQYNNDIRAWLNQKAA